MSTPSQQQRRHHYFLFRHCVRSTGKEMKLHLLQDDEEEQPAAYGPLQSIPIDAFFEEIPHWNVPPNACTQQGLDMVQATGRWLIENKVIEGKKIKIDLLSDTSDRDIDTAYRLSLGIQQAVQDLQESSNDDTDLSLHTTTVDGGNEISYFHDLFEDPLPPELCQSSSRNSSSSSNNNYTNIVPIEETIQAIQKRMMTIPPPMSIPDALERMKILLGGEFGSNAEIILNRLDITQAALSLIHQDIDTNNNNNNETKLYPAGIVEILKLFGQFLFYSRAGGIEPTYLPTNSTTTTLLLQQDVIYQFLAFVHWVRSVWDVKNPQAAASGAVHAQIMLHSLRYGAIISTEWKQYREKLVGHHQPHQRHRLTQSSRHDHQNHHDDNDNYNDDDDDDQDYDTHVTIVVGHDGDLDNMSTALGIQWEFQPPYISSSSSSSSSRPGDYLPTPPLSALHVVRSFTKSKDDNDNIDDEMSVPDLDLAIDISMLYPIYSNGISWSNNTNAMNGILTSSEVLWDSNNSQESTFLAMKTKQIPQGSLSRLEYNDDGVTQHEEYGLVNYLQQHIESTIQLEYPSAFGCWETTGTVLHDLHALSTSSIPVGSRSREDIPTKLLVISMSILCLILGFLWGCLWTRWCCHLRVVRRTNRNRQGMMVISQSDDTDSHVICEKDVIVNQSSLSSSTVIDLVDEERQSTCRHDDLEML
jgi:hypothetical protein